MRPLTYNADIPCPVCGEKAEMQFTEGKGKPYMSCPKHKIEALLLGRRRKPWWKRLLGL